MTVKPEGTCNDIRHCVQPLDSYRSAPVLRIFCLESSRRGEKVLKVCIHMAVGSKKEFYYRGMRKTDVVVTLVTTGFTCAWHTKTPCARYHPNLVLR